jgi:hypothetical protein
LPNDDGLDMGCKTVWALFRGNKGPKVPTAGGKGDNRQYIQLGGTEKVAAHRLAWIIDNPVGNFALLSDARVEASHLCFRSRCVNGLHIAMEPRAYNQSRSYCLWRWVDSSVYPARWVDVCPHFPKCLRRGDLLEKVIDPWNEELAVGAEPSLPPSGNPSSTGGISRRMDELLTSFARASSVEPESSILSENGSSEAC